MQDVKEDPEPAEVLNVTEEPSDIEEGGLDLSVPFKPISAYISDRPEMLEQCFRVLGESKLKKMLPDELKVISIDEQFNHILLVTLVYPQDSPIKSVVGASFDS